MGGFYVTIILWSIFNLFHFHNTVLRWKNYQTINDTWIIMIRAVHKSLIYLLDCFSFYPYSRIFHATAGGDKCQLWRFDIIKRDSFLILGSITVHTFYHIKCCFKHVRRTVFLEPVSHDGIHTGLTRRKTVELASVSGPTLTTGTSEDWNVYQRLLEEKSYVAICLNNLELCNKWAFLLTLVQRFIL